MTQRNQLILYQFAFSHYNEKVRWALDYKALRSERRSLLPGLHEGTIRKLSGDSTTTPVLVDGDLTVSGSAKIVEHLESLAPSPPLFPTDRSQRREAKEWVRWLDEEIGPAVRLALFHDLFQDSRFSGMLFTTGKSGWKAALYRKFFPGMAPMLRKRMGIDEESAVLARKTAEAGLRRVAEASQATGYLVGDRFSVADLTAASLLFPLFFPAEIPFDMPDVDSPVFDAWLERWRNLPGAEYVRAICSKHR